MGIPSFRAWRDCVFLSWKYCVSSHGISHWIDLYLCEDFTIWASHVLTGICSTLVAMFRWTTRVTRPSSIKAEMDTSSKPLVPTGVGFSYSANLSSYGSMDKKMTGSSL